MNIFITSYPKEDEDGLFIDGEYSFSSSLDLDATARLTRIALLIDATLTKICEGEGISRKDMNKILRHIAKNATIK